MSVVDLMNLVAIYARVSTDMQGDSLENQTSYAEEFISRLGDNFKTNENLLYKDFDVSGYYTRFIDRPAIKKALDDAAIGKYKVIVFKELSRITRDQAETIELISRFQMYGVRIIAINDSLDTEKPESLDMLGIKSWLNELESKRISSRVSSNKKGIARRGFFAQSEPPIGYKINKKTRKLEIDEELKYIPEIIFQKYVEEDLGTFKIAEHLNESGYFTKRGKLWERSAVNKILKNRAYIGELIYGKTRSTLKRIYDENGYTKKQAREPIPKDQWIVIENAHEPIISEFVFNKAQEKMVSRYKQKSGRLKHPLTGILKCGKCGSNMICQKRSVKQESGNVYDYRYYTCSYAFKFGRNMCNQKNLRAEVIEKEILTFLMETIKKELKNSHIELEKTSNVNIYQIQIKKIDKELRKTQIALERLFETNNLPAHMFDNLKNKYVSSINALENEKQQIINQSQVENEKSMIYDDLKKALTLLSTVDLTDINTLRSVFHGLIIEIKVSDEDLENIQLHYNYFS